MGISPGLFNRTLVLQRYSETDDGQGGVTKAWSDAGSFRARISPLTANERISQDKTTSLTTHRIFCNPIDISHEDRIRWNSVYFEILGIINPSEMYHHLEIEVREIY